MNEAIRQVTHVQNIRYDKATERLYIIDQTLLPNEEKEIELRTVEEMIEAIKMLRIRGAPAIGICAGYCMYALARDIDAKDNETFYRKLQIDGELLGAARPTAVNLRWAVGEMMKTAKAHLAPSCWRRSGASTSACLPTRPAPFCKGRGSPAMSCSGRGWT